LVSEYKIIPLQGRILFRKDEAESKTAGGIALPEGSKKPNLTGRIVMISPDIENNEELPIRAYDKVLINPSRMIPVDFDSDNQLYILPVADVIAVFQKVETKAEAETSD